MALEHSHSYNICVELFSVATFIASSFYENVPAFVCKRSAWWFTKHTMMTVLYHVSYCLCHTNDTCKRKQFHWTRKTCYTYCRWIKPGRHTQREILTLDLHGIRNYTMEYRSWTSSWTLNIYNTRIRKDFCELMQNKLFIFKTEYLLGLVGSS